MIKSDLLLAIAYDNYTKKNKKPPTGEILVKMVKESIIQAQKEKSQSKLTLLFFLKKLKKSIDKQYNNAYNVYIR